MEFTRGPYFIILLYYPFFSFLYLRPSRFFYAAFFASRQCIQLLVFAIFRFIVYTESVLSEHEVRANTEKRLTLLSQCNFVPIEFRDASVCHLSSKQQLVVAARSIESSL